MLHSQLQQKRLCECLNVWSEELNGAERADLWHCGASTWQTEEKPEPARNELVWAGVIICPAARADSLFRDLNWSSCNGVCGPEYRMRELQCHAMLYTSINNMVVCNPTFFEIQPEICLCAEFSSAFDFFFFKQRSHIFIAVNLSLTFECFAVLTNLDSAAFYSVRRERRPDVASRIWRTSVHICPGIELIFFFVASTVLCFVFSMK